ncbi:hypothetical protein [Fibrobacter succinogenes]|uniref:hypothetical protein n=1 Tax=Fibrobacter succinogenes TaxID=833 RepID=UPI0015646206|nr:hypothetical protein [Fibrobacter succinogenes]
MSENNEETKLPSQIIFDNLKEFLRAKNAAHESIFKFHWKKMWPFNRIWPQVDFERIVRLMSEIRKNIISQQNLVLQAKSKAKPFEKTFLDAVPAYLEALDQSCKGLADIAQWKQDMLYKKIHHEAKVIRDSRDYNTLLKAYEKEQADLVRAGAFVQVGWMEIAGKA